MGGFWKVQVTWVEEWLQAPLVALETGGVGPLCQDRPQSSWDLHPALVKSLRPHPDSPVLSLSFHQSHDPWVATAWKRCLTLTLTAVLSWQSLLPADTNSMSQSLPALAGPQAPRIHTRPCPSWKCLKKRWGTPLPECFPGGWWEEECRKMLLSQHMWPNAM